MDNIDKLIEKYGVAFTEESDNCTISYHRGLAVLIQSGNQDAYHVCTIGEYKERLQKQELIQLIESICTDDAASIANVILRNGWVKK